MSEETIYVDCPLCGGRLEVAKNSGKVVGHWVRPDAKAAGGDIVRDALRKQAEEKLRLEQYFNSAPDKLSKKSEELDKLFEAEKKRIHKEKDYERPENPFDLD
ncbi:MAG: hypothetical protein PHW69_03545 [Elusimicrobiaceae bacterium]|nr:hypothetical protein [Elusimicrobiaceae bacterium]